MCVVRRCAAVLVCVCIKHLQTALYYFNHSQNFELSIGIALSTQLSFDAHANRDIQIQSLLC